MKCSPTPILTALVSVVGSFCGISAETRWEPPFPSLPPTGDEGARWELIDPFPLARYETPSRIVPGPDCWGGRMVVVGKDGRVMTFDPADGGSAVPELLLDIRDRTQSGFTNGMVGLAFHPEYGEQDSANREYVYVRYAYSPDLSVQNRYFTPSYQRLSRFNVPPETRIADPNSEVVFIEQYDRHAWHNGGHLMFGADGFLYTPIGDEGPAHDAFDVAQKIDGRLLSGIIRIDVDNDPSKSHPIRKQPVPVEERPDGWPVSHTANYGIPNDNPWVDAHGGRLEEFWTIGLRSPHTAWMDPDSGEIWVGDVGQYSREEISVFGRGDNGQWPYKEGDRWGVRPKPTQILGAERPPMFVYNRDEGSCVIAGFRYSGGRFGGALDGAFLYADTIGHWLKALEFKTDGSVLRRRFLADVPRARQGGFWAGPVSIAPGPEGRVFVLYYNGEGFSDGRVLELVRHGALVEDPPALLSETGFFKNIATCEVVDDAISYDVAAPLWAGNAQQQRWVWLPDGADGNRATIGFAGDAPFSFPVGTITVKHFSFGHRPVETRFFVHASDGRWYGVSYKWNADGSDAVLLAAGEEGVEDDYLVDDKIGGQTLETWSFPSRQDCLRCHSQSAGSVLAFRTHQLNFDAKGSGNQLVALSATGVFDRAVTPGETATLPSASGLGHPSATATEKVLSYLDSNCAHCHAPEVGNGSFDLRFTTPLEKKNLINAIPIHPSGEAPGERVVAPGSPSRSLLFRYLISDGPDRMPLLVQQAFDGRAIDLIAAWIASLDESAYPVPGLNYRYWETDQNSVDAGIPLQDADAARGSGLTSGLDLGLRRRDEYFMISFKGKIRAMESGIHQFLLDSEGAGQILIDGTTVVEDGSQHLRRSREGNVMLTEGLHDFEVVYYLETGVPYLSVEIARPGGERQVLALGDVLREPVATGVPPVTTGLASWLDASYLPSPGAYPQELLPHWIDRSTSGNDATVIEGAQAPVRNVSFYPWGKAPAVRFSPEATLALPALGLEDYSVFAVERYAGPVRKRLVTNLGETNWLFGFWEGSHAMFTDGFVGLATPADTAWHLHSATGGTDEAFYVDGLVAGLGGGNASPERIAFNGWNTDERSDAEVAEFLLYDRSLTDEERQETERYLYTKWLDPLGAGVMADEAPGALMQAVFGGEENMAYVDLPGGAEGVQFSYRSDIPNLAITLESSSDLDTWVRVSDLRSLEETPGGRLLATYGLAPTGAGSPSRAFVRVGIRWAP